MTFRPVFVALLSVLALSCDTAESSLDASVENADARWDEGGDGTDAAFIDAGPDSGLPREPEWTPVAGTDACLEVARIPQAVLRELPLRDCPGIPNCREVDVRWGGPSERDLFRVESVNPRTDGSATLAFSRRVFPDWLELIIASSTGEVHAAYRSQWRNPRLCLQGPSAVTGSRIVVSVIRFVTPDEQDSPVILTAPLSDPTDLRRVSEFSPGFPQSILASDDVVAVDMIGNVLRVAGEGTVEIVGGGLAALEAVVGDAVFVTRRDAQQSIVVRDSAGERTLIAPPGMEAAGLRTDGERMVWYQLAAPDGALWNSVELHLAPYTQAPPVTARKLWDDDRLGPSDDFVVSFGHILRTEAGGRMSVYDVAGNLVDTFDGTPDFFPVPEHSYRSVSVFGASYSAVSRLPQELTYRWYAR